MTNFLQIMLFCVAGMFAVAAVLGYWKAKVASYLLLAGMVLLAIGIGSIYIPEHRWVPLYKGETTLWFALAVSGCGYALFKLNTRSWLIGIFAAFAVLFLLSNLLHPERFSAIQPPVLQSMWFVPHVCAYMLSYLLLLLATLFSCIAYKRKMPTLQFTVEVLLKTGFGLFSLGMVIGMLWAKEAWGNYWTWDLKETWALVAWLLYYIYIYARLRNKTAALLLLLVAMCCLLFCKFGLHLLPQAPQSLHIYGH